MKKNFLIGVMVLLLLAGGCKKEEATSGTHKPSLEGKVIDIRENNEILIEITAEGEGYKKGDNVLIGYLEYYWIDPYDPNGYSHEDLPKLNDMVAIGYWEHEIEKKDGYDYIPQRRILKLDMKLQGRVIEVMDNNEIMIEVTKRGEQYKSGDVILVSYQKYFYRIDSKETENRMGNAIPKYNDKIAFYYYQENIGEKDGYTYMSNLNIEKYLDGSETE